MIRVLFFVVLVMALVALRNHLRVRRTYAHIGVAVPKHVTVSVLSTGALALLALASLFGLATRLGMTGVIVCGALAYVALLRVAADRNPSA